MLRVVVVGTRTCAALKEPDPGNRAQERGATRRAYSFAARGSGRFGRGGGRPEQILRLNCRDLPAAAGTGARGHGWTAPATALSQQGGLMWRWLMNLGHWMLAPGPEIPGTLPSEGLPGPQSPTPPANPTPAAQAEAIAAPAAAAKAQASAIPDYKIASAPTISLHVFVDALVHHASPAVMDLEAHKIYTSLADELYSVCLAWGVNPAVALAFFDEESSMGTDRRWYGANHPTKNWGNLRRGPAQMKDDGVFAYYSSYVVALDDFCRLLRGSLYEEAGLLTVSQVVPKYAPGTDNNDTNAYVKAVNTQIAVWEAMG